MNKKLKIFLHVSFWVMMFLSPLAIMRGPGVTLPKYLVNCMTSLLPMLVFYINFLWLTPKYFVAGKHRYHLLINFIMVVCLGFFLHYWICHAHLLFTSVPPTRQYSLVESMLYIVRDITNLSIFAACATAFVLAMRWQQNEDAMLEADAVRAEAELKNLRSQINPHFLLNTLNNIYALAAIDYKKAQDAIQQLSILFRHVLYDNQQEDVALKDEIQFLENYVNLMKIRLPKNVEVLFDTKVENPDARVAPLLFISLVENAFKHGVSPTEPSFVHIHLTTENNILECLIENSNFPKTEQDRSGHGLGLQQVQHRLDLSYYEQYEWENGVSADGKNYRSRVIVHLKH